MGLINLVQEQEDIIDDFLEPQIRFFQQLEVYQELGLVEADRVTVTFQHQDWTSDPVRIRQTGDTGVTELTETTDYLTSGVSGNVTLTSGLTIGDEIRGTYRFAYFRRTEDLGSFTQQALDRLNGRKPATAFTFESAPKEWDTTIALGAYIYCLERLLLDLNLWRNRWIMDDPDGARAFLTTLKNEAHDTWKEDVKALKRRGNITVQGVSSGKFFTQQLVTESNFRRFTTIGAGG